MLCPAELRPISASKVPPRQEHALLPGCQRFLFAELDAATGHFAEEHVIGEGGFGRVYRGALWCGAPVAVKRLDRRGLQVGMFHVYISTVIMACIVTDKISR